MESQLSPNANPPSQLTSITYPHRAKLYFFTDENIRRTNAFLQKIKPFADEKGITIAQLVLRWTINKPGITIALAGARNAQQAVANTKASDVRLTTQEMETINGHLRALELVRRIFSSVKK